MIDLTPLDNASSWSRAFTPPTSTYSRMDGLTKYFLNRVISAHAYGIETVVNSISSYEYRICQADLLGEFACWLDDDAHRSVRLRSFGLLLDLGSMSIRICLRNYNVLR